MRRGLIEEGFESTAVKSGPINELEALLSKLLFLVQTSGTAYQLMLHRQAAPAPGQPLFSLQKNEQEDVGEERNNKRMKDEDVFMKSE